MSELMLPSYEGPLELSSALSQYRLVPFREADFTLEGPRADAQYRDLGLAQATGGRLGAKHIRAFKPFEKETGWHWHDMSAHFVYVLKGWISFRIQGIADTVTVHAGGSLSQPAGVPHNVIARSDDLEVIEINLPARFGTFDARDPDEKAVHP